MTTKNDLINRISELPEKTVELAGGVVEDALGILELSQPEDNFGESFGDKIILTPKPEEGVPSQPKTGVVAVVFNKLVINNLYDKLEDKPKGDLIFKINDQEKRIKWKKDENGNFVSQGIQLVFAGFENTEFMSLDIGLIESERDEEKDITKLQDFFDSISKVAGLIPVYGTVVGAGLSFASVIAEMIKGGLDDETELRFLGAIDRRTGKDGPYVLVRKDNAGTTDDIMIKFSVKTIPENVEPKQEVVITLRKVEFRNIDTSIFEASDTLMIHSALTGRVGNKKKIIPFDFQQRLYNKDQHKWLTDVLAIKDTVLYRGYIHEGIRVSLSAAVIKASGEDNLKKWEELIKKAGKLSKVALKNEAWAGSVAEDVHKVYAALLELAPEDTKRIYVDCDSVLIANSNPDGTSADPVRYVNNSDNNNGSFVSGSFLEKEFKLLGKAEGPQDGEVVFTLGIRAL